MQFSLLNPSTYSPLASSDSEVGIERKDLVNPIQPTKKPCTVRHTVFLIICAISLGLFVLLGLYGLTNPSSLTTYESPKTCLKPKIRREWRSLSEAEKESYIAAAKCLTEIPSKSGANGSVHDNFSYIHSKIGKFCKTPPHSLNLARDLLSKVILMHMKAHKAAQFLPWHRYFLYKYEELLQTQCGYSDSLPYDNTPPSIPE